MFFMVLPLLGVSIPACATPLGEVTKFIVAQVSNWNKVPCSREQQQQNWVLLSIEPGTLLAIILANIFNLLRLQLQVMNIK